MNDRLNVQVLRSQLQEAISRIEPLPDEPTFSYVTRVSLLTGTTKRGEVITELFGRSNIRPEQLVHGGFGNFAKHFSSADGVCKDDLSLAHSMLSLFAPFLSSDRLLRAKNRALGSNAIGIIKFVGLRKEQVFRGSPAVCVDCIASDLQKMRFAYHRRVLQVSAVTVCPDHGTPLTTYCEKCGKTLSYEDLPSLHCQTCGEPLRAGAIGQPSIADLEIAVKFAKMIQACLNGMMPNVDVARRASALRCQVALKISNRSGVIGENLTRRLCEVYSRGFLKSVGLCPDNAPVLGWPALMVSGMLLSTHPIANCLIVALLFNSIDDYKETLESTPKLPHRSIIASCVKNAATRITPTVLKEIMRPGTLRDVGSKHQIKLHLLKKWVATYPGLSARRKVSAGRLMVRRLQRRMAEHIRTHPGDGWIQMEFANQFDNGCLIRNQKKWLKIVSPTQSDVGGVIKSDRVPTPAKDRDMAEALLRAVDREMGKLSRPNQLYLSLLLNVSGLAAVPVSHRYSFRETVALISKLTETAEAYYRRCIEWGAKDLIRSNGRCDHIIELFVHARVSVKHVRALEPYARDLLAELADTRKN